MKIIGEFTDTKATDEFISDTAIVDNCEEVFFFGAPLSEIGSLRDEIIGRAPYDRDNRFQLSLHSNDREIL